MNKKKAKKTNEKQNELIEILLVYLVVLFTNV